MLCTMIGAIILSINIYSFQLEEILFTTSIGAHDFNDCPLSPLRVMTVLLVPCFFPSMQFIIFPILVITILY